MKNVILTLSALIWFGVLLLGQQVERYGVAQGLSQGFVTALLQDREGFIWAGTQNGLNRFDGHRFKFFEHDPFDPYSLSGNHIYYLYDAADYLLVATASNGFCLFHKKTQRFFRLPYTPGASKLRAPDPMVPIWLDKLPQPGVGEFCIDGEGTIWIRTYDVSTEASWMCRMVLPEKFWERLTPERGMDAAREQALFSQIKYECWQTSATLFGLMRDGKTMSYALAGKLFAWRNQRWEPLPLPNKLPWDLNNFHAQAGLGYLLESQDYPNPEQAYRQEPLGEVAPIFRNAQKHYCFHADGKWSWWTIRTEVMAFPMQASPLYVDFSAPRWSFPIVNEERILYVFDRSGNLWVANSVYGLVKFTPALAGRFRHYLEGVNIPYPLVAMPNGNYFYYNWGKDFVFARPEGEQEAFLRNAFTSDDHWRGGVRRDERGEYWMVVAGQQKAFGKTIVIRADPLRKTSRRYEVPLQLMNTCRFEIDPDGSIWFPVHHKLLRFDPADGNWQAFDFEQLQIGNVELYDIAKTADGSWWVASVDGLVRGKPVGSSQSAVGSGQISNQPVNHSDIQSLDFQIFRTNPADPNSLRSNVVASLLTDPQDGNILWIGTKGGGLNRLDVRTMQFTHITTKDGLPDNVIYAVLPEKVDRAGNLWLSCNRGIVRYNPATGEMKNYRQADGLQSDEFNTRAYGMGLNGEMLFGGVNGFNVFNPKDLTDNPNKPNVILTGLKINNLPVESGDPDGILPEAIEFCPKIVLPYSKNDVTLEFAALEFTTSSRNRYRYWMDGLEKKDAHESNEPYATYLSLPPGNYTFIVYGSNNDGVWSEQPARLKITVLPPWYRHSLAYIGYAALLTGLLFWYQKMRERRKNLEHRLETERREAGHLHEMNRLKLEDFTQRLLEKSELITQLQQRNSEENELGARKPATQKDWEKLYASQLFTKTDWGEFQAFFEQVYPGFLSQLAARFPALTPAEVRLLSLMKMKLQREKIASMLGVSPDTVSKTKHRLNRKLELVGTELEDIVESL